MLSAVQGGLFEGRILAFLNMRKNSTEKNNTGGPQASANAPLLLTVRITDIAERADWQVRIKINSTTVNSYRTIYKSHGTMDPVQLARVDGALYLVDGWHRLAALRLLGRDEVEASIFDATMHEAHWRAAIANTKHGLPLKRKELRNVFRAYIKSRQHRKHDGSIKSYRTMENDLGNLVVFATLRNWMKKDFSKIAAEMSDQYGDVDKARYHGGEAPRPESLELTPLEAAKAKLDSALAEARSMSPRDREDLMQYAAKALKGIGAAGPWGVNEAVLPNDDF